MKLLLFVLLVVGLFAQGDAGGDGAAAGGDGAAAGGEKTPITPPAGGAKFNDYTKKKRTSYNIYDNEIKVSTTTWDGVNIVIFYDEIKEN